MVVGVEQPFIVQHDFPARVIQGMRKPNPLVSPAYEIEHVAIIFIALKEAVELVISGGEHAACIQLQHFSALLQPTLMGATSSGYDVTACR